MADYFTKFSFVIPVTPEQGGWFTRVHGLAEELLGHAEDGGARENIEGPEDVVSAVRRLVEKRDGFPCVQVTHDEEEGTIWVYSDDSGDPDYTVDLARAFLNRFDLDLVVSFQWANTCSKPRLDAFGGGAVVISRRNAVWFNTGMLLEKAAKAETTRLRLKSDEELDDADFDGDVHGIASSLASDANNGGPGFQLDFLLEHGWNPPEHLLRDPRA